MSREFINLNPVWKFHRHDIPQAWYKGFDDSCWRQVRIPHDWSVEEPFSQEYSSGTGYAAGGIGWYRKHFRLPEELRGKKVIVTFEGIYNNSQVWCNSYYLGKRPYGYSSFTYDLTPFVEFGDAENVLTVKVNHKDIADSRWFTGSGIYRNVYLTVTGKVHIEPYGVFVSTPEVSNDAAELSVQTSLSNETGKVAAALLKNTLSDRTGKNSVTAAVMVNIPPNSCEKVEQRLKINHPDLWSPDDPNLYNLQTSVIINDEITDQVNTKAGIRWFEFDPDKGFVFNGTNTKMKGVCVHHDAGCLGAAVPKQVWARRLQKLKDLGCNAIRMSHNPPAPELLDLCDEMGFFVMDEAFDEWEGVKNKWWQGHNVYPPKHEGYYEDFPQWGETDIKDMVLRDRNHPSIIMWSIGNEVDYPNDPYCHPYFKTMTGNNDHNKPSKERKYDPCKPNADRLVTIAGKLSRYVKECDTTRPVTAAVAFPELSNLTGYTEVLDIVGYNYKEQLYENDHKNYPGRVFYGSENGHGYENWLAVKNNDYICAQFLWTGFDYLGEAKGWPIRISTAGLMNLAGFEKTRYFFRQSLWKNEPVIYLTARPHKEEQILTSEVHNSVHPHWNWKDQEKVDLICFTNCEEAEFFINDKSVGSRELKDFKQGFICLQAAFTAGTVKAVGKKAGITVTSELKTAGEAYKLEISSDKSFCLANGEDIVHIEIQAADRGGNPVYLTDNDIQVTVEGQGRLLGLENGEPSDLEPYSSSHRRLYQGRLLAYIQSLDKAGEIKITASSEGLVSDSILVTVNKK